MHKHEHLSTEGVAARLGRDRSTINRWVRQGRLTPAVEFPGKTGARLFDPADVDKLAADLTTEVQS
jgi:transposase